MARAIPLLPADDLRVAKAFYVDGLGFSIRFESSQDGIAGILGLERGGIALTIDAPMSGHGRGSASRSKSRTSTSTMPSGADASARSAHRWMRLGARAPLIYSTRAGTPSSSWGRSPRQAVGHLPGRPAGRSNDSCY